MFRQVTIPVLKNSRSFSVDAKQLFNNSCYSKVDYKINESEPVHNAVIKLSAFDIECVVSVDKYLKKVIIRDVCTFKTPTF